MGWITISAYTGQANDKTVYLPCTAEDLVKLTFGVLIALYSSVKG